MSKNKSILHLILFLVLVGTTIHFVYSSFFKENIEPKTEQNVKIIDNERKDIKNSETEEENIYLVKEESRKIEQNLQNKKIEEENVPDESLMKEDIVTKLDIEDKITEILPYSSVINVEGKNYEVGFQEENTILKDLMDKLQAESDFSYSGINYSGLGFFVNEINGIKNSNKYWVYYLNGVSARAGISIQKINSGDNIEWKYENSTF